MILDRTFNGAVDLNRLNAAARALIDESDALRTGLTPSAGTQTAAAWWDDFVISVRPTAQIKVDDWGESILPPPSPIDLKTPPLLRIERSTATESGDRIRLVTSHAISDAISLGLLWNTLLQRYNGIDLSASQRTYEEYRWLQYNDWTSGKWQESIAYFRDSLSDVVPWTMPVSAEPLTIWPVMKAVWFRVPEQAFTELRELAVDLRITQFGLIMGLFGLALRDVFGWSDPVVLTPIANRPARWMRSIVGLFANILPVRISSEGGTQAAATETWERFSKSSRHGHIPLFYLLDQVPEIGSLIDRCPRIGLRQPNPASSAAQKANRAANEDHGSVTLKFKQPPTKDYWTGTDLLLDTFWDEEGLTLRVSYRANKFSAGNVDRLLATMIEHLGNP